jgi:hypothetical protein
MTHTQACATSTERRPSISRYRLLPIERPMGEGRINPSGFPTTVVCREPSPEARWAAGRTLSWVTGDLAVAGKATMVAHSPPYSTATGVSSGVTSLASIFISTLTIVPGGNSHLSSSGTGPRMR